MTTIDRPGVYDIPHAEYIADPVIEPSLNASIGKVLIERTPLHAWFEHPRLNPAYDHGDDSKFDVGSAAHDMFLTGSGRIATLDFRDYKTDAAKLARAEAVKAGKTPLLTKQVAEMRFMVQAIRDQLKTHKDASDAFSDGEPERTLVWQEEIDGVKIWCRAKLDWLPNANANRRGPVLLDDLKTTGDANAREFRKRIFDLGYDISGMFYARGFEKLFGVRALPRWVAIEDDKPHALNVVGLLPQAIEMAQYKVDEMLRRWAACMTGGFRGYAPYTSLVDSPPWHATEFEERLERRKALHQYYIAEGNWPAVLPAKFFDYFGV